jgi:hypothetical protein
VKIYLQNGWDDIYRVWISNEPKTCSELYDGTVYTFNPIGKGGFYLDAYSFAKTKSEELGFELEELVKEVLP